MTTPLRTLFFIMLTLSAIHAMAIDIAPLWDFNDPKLSEQRFRAALKTADGDDRLILQTQIARTQGLRRDFDGTRADLREVEPALAQAGPEARARYQLELGRSYASATHPAAALTDEAKARARHAFQSALDAARRGGLDGLAIDAVHMFAFVDTTPEQQLQWGREALAIVEASDQPAARRWEAPVRNNLGHALHQLGRYDEALAQFRVALGLRQKGSNAEATRSAWWIVAWTLRSLGRNDEALPIQLRLEREAEAAGQPDPYVFEELALLFSGQGDVDRAQRYEALRKAQDK